MKPKSKHEIYFFNSLYASKTSKTPKNTNKDTHILDNLDLLDPIQENENSTTQRNNTMKLTVQRKIINGAGQKEILTISGNFDIIDPIDCLMEYDKLTGCLNEIEKQELECQAVMLKLEREAQIK